MALPLEVAVEVVVASLPEDQRWVLGVKLPGGDPLRATAGKTFVVAWKKDGPD